MQSIFTNNKRELFALSVALIFLLFHYIFPETVKVISFVLLAVGMIFLGIPHGAVDHHLSLEVRITPYFLFWFIIKYLFIMALTFMLWKISTILGLIVFIIYSAWHFGETDMRKWNSFQPVVAFISGLSLLLFILFSHPTEFASYLNLFGLHTLQFNNVVSITISVISLFVFFVIGMLFIKNDKSGFLLLMAILIVGIGLPLLLAFGIYFIIIHSSAGWEDIRKGLKISHTQLLLKALPFTLGAFLLFAGFFFYHHYYQPISEYYIPTFFIALSCLSAPHVLMMSAFYKHLME